MKRTRTRLRTFRAALAALFLGPMWELAWKHYSRKYGWTLADPYDAAPYCQRTNGRRA